MTIGNDVAVPNDHEIALTQLGITIVRSPAESGSDDASTEILRSSRTQNTPKPISDRNKLRTALNSWVYTDNINEVESSSRFNVAQNLMRRVADADLSQREGGELCLRIAADVDLPENLATALRSSGISIERLSAAGSSRNTGNVQGGYGSSSVLPQHEPNSSEMNTSPVGLNPEDNSGGKTLFIMRLSPNIYRRGFSAWCAETGVSMEEVERRRQSAATLVDLATQVTRAAQTSSGSTNFDLRSLENFSSPPPIPTTASVVTVKPDQFPEPHLAALRNLGVTIEVREASALTIAERNSWVTHLQGWASLGGEREADDRATAGTRILAFLDRRNLHETLDLSGLNISDLPGNLFPNEDTSRYVRSVNLHNTRVHAAILDFLQANGIALSR